MSFVFNSFDMSAVKPEQAFVRREPWGIYFGERVERITFGDVETTSGAGIQVSIITYGGIVQSVKHRRVAGGAPQELTLGYDNLQAYVDDTSFMGATVGRYANRIRDGRFSLPGLTTSEDDVVNVQLLTNDGLNTLHGGPGNFSKVVWKVLRLVTPDAMEGGDYVGVVLGLRSFDGDQGFPGTMDIEAHYLVRVRHGEFKMRYKATLVDGIASVCSLTNHCYWNLSGCVDEPGPPSRPRSFSQSLDAEEQHHVPAAAAAAAAKPGELPPLAPSGQSSTTSAASALMPPRNGRTSPPPVTNAPPRDCAAPAGDSSPEGGSAAGPHVTPSIESHFVKLKADFYLTTMPGEPLPDGGIARLRTGPVQSLAMLAGEATFGTVNKLLEAEAEDEEEGGQSPMRAPVSRTSSGAAAAATGGQNALGGTGGSFRGSRQSKRRGPPPVHTTPALDHCFVVRGVAGTLRPAARVWCPKSGRQARVWTTLPSVQVYTGNHLPERSKGRHESEFGPRCGFCIETQMFPDAPNHPHFPSTLMRQGDVWDHETIWVFD